MASKIREPPLWLDALDDVVRSAHPIRFTNHVFLDRDRAYQILDEMRASVIAPLRELRLYRLKREEENGTPLGSSLGSAEVLVGSAGRERACRLPKPVSGAGRADTGTEQQEPSDVLKLIQEVDDLVFAAKMIPLTNQKRLDPAQVKAITIRMRSALFREIEKPSELQALIDKLDDLMQNANAVHFTSQVRIDGEEIFDILHEMRGALGRARTR